MRHEAHYHMRNGSGDCEKAFNHPTNQTKMDSEAEARKVVQFLSRKMKEAGYENWLTWKIEFIEKDLQVLGRAFPGEERIELYLGGQDIGTLIHELAHQFGCGHDRIFQQTQEVLLDLWEQYQVEIEKVLQPPPDMGEEDEQERWELAEEEILDAVDTRDQVTMLHIGTVLQRYKLNSTKNIATMRKLVKDQGVMIVALVDNSPYSF